MDFIILNSDGSLQKQSLTRYIQQGSHGVDEIFIGWANATSSQTLQAVFTLPNQLTNTELGTFESNYEYEPGETMSGWVITLTENQTRYNGALMVSARIILNGIVQVAYPFALIINETGVMPENDSGITLAQLDSYLLNIQNLVTDAVRQNTDAFLSSTSENPVQNKVVTGALTHVEEVAEGKCKSTVLDYAFNAFTETTFNQVSGSVYAEDGTELSTWAEYQAYISGRSLGNSLFNSQNNTITINKTDYYFLKQDGYDWVVYKTFADFKTGDILLVVETEVPDRWFGVYTSNISFYKMEGTKVDISNMVTTDTEQTITGEKTINSGSASSYLNFGNSYDSIIYAIGKNNEWFYIIRDGTVKLAISSGQTYSYNSIRPGYSNLDLGSESYSWKDIYLTGSLKDGTNSIAVANIGKKLYKHTIQTDGGGGADLFIISNRSTAYTLPMDWLSLNTDAIKVLCNGYLVLRIYESGGYYYAQCVDNTNTIIDTSISASTIDDTVTAIN